MGYIIASFLVMTGFLVLAALKTKTDRGFMLLAPMAPLVGIGSFISLLTLNAA